MTNSKDTVLRFEIITELLEAIILEYTGFELLDDKKYGWYYKRYRVVQKEQKTGDHMNCRRGQTFVICKNAKVAWWGPCDDNVPIRDGDEIKWNLNQQIRSIKMLIRKSVQCEHIVGMYGEISIIMQNKNLFGKYGGAYSYRKPFSGTVSDINKDCKGTMIFPDINRISLFSFEYLENDCTIKWSAGTDWIQNKCAKKTTSCNTIDDNECPTSDYYINPDGNGMIRVHCHVNQVNTVRTYIFLRRHSYGRILSIDDTTANSLYDGVYLDNGKRIDSPRKFFWVGYKDFYRLIEVIQPDSFSILYNSNDVQKTDTFQGFKILNNRTYELVYGESTGHQNSFANLENTSLQNCNSFSIWWQCKIKSSPFDANDIYWKGYTRKYIEFYLETKKTTVNDITPL